MKLIRLKLFKQHLVQDALPVNPFFVPPTRTSSRHCHCGEQRAWSAEPLPGAPVELTVPSQNCELRNRKLGSPFSCVPLVLMARDL
jgi:hypothetical protein